MNIYLVIILTALIGEFVLQCIVRYLNLKSLNTDLPDEFRGFYHEDEYRKSQKYTRAQTKFEYVSSTSNIILLVAFILLGGFNYVDTYVRSFNAVPILTGLMWHRTLSQFHSPFTIILSLRKSSGSTR